MTTVARRALARAVRRPALICAFALLGGGSFVIHHVARPPAYWAALHFRIREGDLPEARNAPRPPRNVRRYINEVALSRDTLERIMRKHHVSEAFLARDRVEAIEAFRDDIHVDLERNYFLYDRDPSDEPRSAYVTVAIKGVDPERTRKLLHDIGDAILQDQASRRERLAGAGALLRDQLERERARTKALIDAIRELSPAAADGVSPGGRLAAVESQHSVERVATLERRAAGVALAAAAEGQQLGLTFDLVDESVLAVPPPLTAAQLAAGAVLALTLTLALIVPVVGAFDDRIWEPEDLQILGVPVVASVPWFPGADAASYRTRTSTGNA